MCVSGCAIAFSEQDFKNVGLMSSYPLLDLAFRSLIIVTISSGVVGCKQKLLTILL